MEKLYWEFVRYIIILIKPISTWPIGRPAESESGFWNFIIWKLSEASRSCNMSQLDVGRCGISLSCLQICFGLS